MLTTCSGGAHSCRMAAAWARIVVFCLSVSSILAGTCPGASLSSSTSTGGHFIAGSIAWRHLYGNTVTFELTTVWRRSYHWPCPIDTGFSGIDGYPAIGDLVHLSGISLIGGSLAGARQTAAGPARTTFDAGDGTQYELILNVTSYSMTEDWFTAISHIEHTYSGPYKRLDEWFPPAYTISSPDKFSSQPYTTIPWSAMLVGCCRRWFVDNPDASSKIPLDFQLRAEVDISNMVSSARIVTLPVVSLPFDSQQRRISICALPVAGVEALTQQNGGNLHWPSDDMSPAAFFWKIRNSSLTAAIIQGENDVCILINFPDVPGPNAVNDYISLGLNLGNSYVEGDFSIKLNAQNNFTSFTDAVNTFSCNNIEPCKKQLNLGRYLGVSDVQWYVKSDGPAMELRYVVATGAKSSPMVATSQTNLIYATDPSELDFAHMPNGAKLIPVSDLGQYVTAIDVMFSASKLNTDPLADLPLSNANRDYVNVAAIPSFSAAVSNSNFNLQSGGASTTIILERLNKDLLGFSSDGGYSLLAAVTSIILANSSQVDAAISQGYTLVNKNLLEQSNRGAIYLLFKRGSGPPVLDVATTPMAGYTTVQSLTYLNDKLLANITIFVKYSNEQELIRYFSWRPCTYQDEPIVLCVASVFAGSGYSGPQKCMYVDPFPRSPPVVTPQVQGVFQATMGQLAQIQIDVTRIDVPRSINIVPPSIKFYWKDGVSSMDRGQSALLTASTPILAQIVGGDFVTPGLTSKISTGDSSSGNLFVGYFQWIPSPYHGGWTGLVCFDVCISTDGCPAVPGPDQICNTSCVSLSVQKCKWAVQMDDTFVEIAPRFQTNWLQLWYLNPLYGHPDQMSINALPSLTNAVINVGQVYRPRWDDTLQLIAERFGISHQRLLDLNADLTNISSTVLLDGIYDQVICIIPDPCNAKLA